MTSASADVFLEVLIAYSSYLSLVTKSDKHSVIHLKYSLYFFDLQFLKILNDCL